MRASRPSGLVVLAVVLAGLIVVLGALQWRWVREASQAERQRQQSLLDARVRGFSQDLDREVSRAYGWFVEWPGRGSGPSSRTQAERATQWFAEATRPQIVSDVYVVRGRPDTTLQISRFDPSTSEFVPIDWPDAFAALHERLVKGKPAAGESSPVWRVGPRLDPSLPALIVAHPVLRLVPEAGSPTDPDADIVVTIARLDRDFLAGVVLPELAAKHFPDEPGFRFRVMVRADADGRVLFASPADVRPDVFATADATVPVLRVRNEFLDRSQPDRGQGEAGGRDRDAGGPADATHREGDGGRGGRLPFAWARSLSEGRAVFVTPDMSPGGPRWTLSLVHDEGSIDQAITRSRRWNLGLSLGVLAVLGASVGLTLVASQRAHRLARERIEFVAGVSHELRTPLAVIRSAAENLADGVVDGGARVQQYGTLIADEGRKLSAMVDQVLTFAGLESGQPLRLQPTDVSDVVDEAVRSVAAMADEAGVRVEVVTAPSLPPMQADRDALVRAVANLLTNAVKYGGSGGWVGVTADVDRQGRLVRLAVTDRGPGIAPHEQKRIFEPFVRGQDAVAAQVHGNGLGLSLVKRIAEQHGGRVHLTSHPGTGTTFTLVVPTAAGAPAVEPAATASPDLGPSIAGTPRGR